MRCPLRSEASCFELCALIFELNTMKLPSFFGKKENKEYFLALLLRDEKVTAVIFEELGGIVRVVGKNEVFLNTSLEESTPDEWLESFDNAISRAEETLPENVETQKTIFGVKETWVEDTKIKKEYLLLLKKASDALGLQPIGFLVIHEAIAHLLQEEEGAPVSGILIEIGQKHTTVSLLRAGRVIETKRTANEDNIAQITDRLLHHFTNYEVLPSRILVLSDKHDNEKLSQSFISHSWSKSLPFLHVPQITILPKNFDAKAVLSGAASQMGFELLSGEQQQKEEAASAKSYGPLRQPAASPRGESSSEASEPEEEENFGFIKNADIRINKTKLEEEIIPEKEPEPLETKKPFGKMVLSGLSFVIKNSKKIFSLLPKPSQHNPQKKKFLLIIPIFLLTILALFISYIFFVKAAVSITVTPKIVEQKQDITFSTKTPTDVDKKTIIAKSIEISKEGKTTRSATGKKEIGEKAKGNVTILSVLPKEQTLTKGTTLTSSNSLKFILDETVVIASSSGLSDVKTKKANVVASNIGKESNLPSGVKFTVASFDTSEVEAKNDTAFSGGTKKEVKLKKKCSKK